MASGAGWDAWIEKGWLLWNWTVQRHWPDPPEPRDGLFYVPSRGDHLSGWGFTEAGARKKARKWLANRIAWDAPKPDRRRFVGLDGSD